MSNRPANLCLSCKLSNWERTKFGRLHQSGEGDCEWVPRNIPISAAHYWGQDISGKKYHDPRIVGGRINRNIPITKCETYEAES